MPRTPHTVHVQAVQRLTTPRMLRIVFTGEPV